MEMEYYPVLTNGGKKRNERYRCTLAIINVLLLGVGFIPMGVPVYNNRQHTDLLTSPSALVGFYVSGLFIICISFLGSIGILTESQRILIIYIDVTLFLLIVLMGSSIGAFTYLGFNVRLDTVNRNQQHHNSTMLNCCLSLKGESHSVWCKAFITVSLSCYAEMNELVAKTTLNLGIISLFFALVVGAALYAATKYLDQLRKAELDKGNVSC